MRTEKFIFTVLVISLLLTRQLLPQEDQRSKDAAKVQKALAALSTTKIAKVGSVKAMLLESYKDEETREVIKESPEEELEEILNLVEYVPGEEGEEGKMVPNWTAITGVLDSYFERYEQTIGSKIPYEPVRLKDFVALTAKTSTLRDLIKATLYPADKIYLAEFQYRYVIFRTEESPLKKLRPFASAKDANFSELKEAFLLFTKNYLQENVGGVLDLCGDQVYALRAGPMARWVKKEEMKSPLTRAFQEQPYSLFSVEDFVHTDLLFVAKVKNLPPIPDWRKPWPKDTPWWKGISADWSLFQDGDYLVAAPSMIGMIGNESLGPGDVECYVFRKFGGKWRVVGM